VLVLANMPHAVRVLCVGACSPAAGNKGVRLCYLDQHLLVVSLPVALPVRCWCQAAVTALMLAGAKRLELRGREVTTSLTAGLALLHPR
jgi:hypothetical protein